MRSGLRQRARWTRGPPGKLHHPEALVFHTGRGPRARDLRGNVQGRVRPPYTRDGLCAHASLESNTLDDIDRCRMQSFACTIACASGLRFRSVRPTPCASLNPADFLQVCDSCARQVASSDHIQRMERVTLFAAPSTCLGRLVYMATATTVSSLRSAFRALLHSFSFSTRLQALRTASRLFKL